MERIDLGVDQRKVVSNDVVDPTVCIGGLKVDVFIQGSASTIEVVDVAQSVCTLRTWFPDSACEVGIRKKYPSYRDWCSQFLSRSILRAKFALMIGSTLRRLLEENLSKVEDARR